MDRESFSGSSSISTTSPPETFAQPTTIYYNTGINVPHRKFLYATEYHFQDAGVRQVKQLLKHKLGEDGTSVRCEWKRDDAVFFIACHRNIANKVCGTLHQILQEIIQEQQDGDDSWSYSEISDEDEEESPSDIDSNEEIQDNEKESVSTKIIPISQLKKTSESYNSGHAGQAFFPASITEYEYKNRWTCDSIFDQIAQQHILQQIGNLTETQLVRDEIFPVVYVGGKTRRTCELAVSKLDILHKYHLLPIPKRHVFYTEDVDNYKVCLQFLSDCKKRLFETTLLDNFDDYSLLGIACVAKMAVFDYKTNSYVPHKEDKYKSATEENGCRFRDWFDFKYATHGTNHMSQDIERVENTSRNPTTEIGKAREVVPEGMRVDETLYWVEHLPSVKTFPVTDLVDDVSGNWVQNSQIEAEPLQNARNMSFQELTACQLDKDEPLIEFSDDDDEIKEINQAESEVSTRVFHITMNQKAGKNRNRHRHASLTPNLAARLELPVARPMSRVKLQAPDLNAGVQEAIMQSFKAIMNTIRGYRGVISVQATLGRILLSNIPDQYVNTTPTKPDVYMFPEDAIELLDEKSTNTHFTNILTCAAPDIHFLLDLPTGVDDERMWSKNPISRKVSYEFHLATGDETFIVQMDADSLKFEIQTPRDLGSIFVHGIKRRWDFSIQVQGTTNHEDDSDKGTKYHEIAQYIRDTIFVPEDQEIPQIYFELPSRLVGAYTLESLRVHRISHYADTNKCMNLKVSEIYDLDRSSLTKTEKEIFKAVHCATPRSLSEKTSWYEISIESPTLNEMFEENTKLDIGAEISYTTEQDTQPLLIQHLCLPACQMLKHLDGVGFHNSNGITVERHPKLQPINPPYQFW